MIQGNKNDNKKNPAWGAALYVPGVKAELSAIANGAKIKGVSTIIFCLEDSIAETEVENALLNLKANLPHFKECRTAPHRFLRVRNLKNLQDALSLPGIEKIDGFVLPKVTLANFDASFTLIAKAKKDFSIMPTLETKEVFDLYKMNKLRDLFLIPSIRDRIMAIRIGGNDLFNLLHVRRPHHCTIYETVLGPWLSLLLGIFSSAEMPMTSVVFDHLNAPDLLAREVTRDVEHGFVGKTAIHPYQIPIINKAFLPTEEDLQYATEVLANNEAGVFRYKELMCEPATHRKWAEKMANFASSTV